MKVSFLVISGLLLIVNLINADVYFHNPRGSNNRLNEAGAARTNANRMFDSQVSISNLIKDYLYHDHACMSVSTLSCTLSGILIAVYHQSNNMQAGQFVIAIQFTFRLVAFFPAREMTFLFVISVAIYTDKSNTDNLFFRITTMEVTMWATKTKHQTPRKHNSIW